MDEALLQSDEFFEELYAPLTVDEDPSSIAELPRVTCCAEQVLNFVALATDSEAAGSAGERHVTTLYDAQVELMRCIGEVLCQQIESSWRRFEAQQV